MADFNQYFTTKESSVTDEDYMRQALWMADRAKKQGNPSIGALLRMSSKQLVEHDTTLSEHGKMHTATLNLIHKAADLVPRSMANALLYCTVEPTALDVLTASSCGVSDIIFGCYNLKDGFISSPTSAIKLENCDIAWKGGVLAKECYEILSEDVKSWCSIDDRN
jgi:tRNA(Arg) A34 adenosine deaminase TadA